MLCSRITKQFLGIYTSIIYNRAHKIKVLFRVVVSFEALVKVAVDVAPLAVDVGIDPIFA